MNDKLNNLLTSNKVDRVNLDKKLYFVLLNGLFEYVCKEIVKNNAKTKELNIFRSFKNEIVSVRKIISKYTKCNLTDEECIYLSGLFKAFFRKSARKIASEHVKKELLIKQNYQCPICGKKISIHNSHYDHIIPYDLVGDELENNYQMLCATCNQRKTDNIYYEMAMLLIGK